MDKQPTCAERVAKQAESRIEDIRLCLCPTENDIVLIDDGSLDTVLKLNDREYRYSGEFAAEFRDDSGALDLDALLADVWGEILDDSSDRWYEYGLSFEYVSDDDRPHEPFFRYLISTGGPGEEIRFFADARGNLYRAEFWFLDWFDGASVDVTKDDTVQDMWENFRSIGTIEYMFDAVRKER